MRTTRGSSTFSLELRALGRKLPVGLVQHQHAVIGQRRDELRDGSRIVPGPHGVVGIREVDERRPARAHACEDRLQIDAIVAVGDRLQVSAEPRDLVVEGRIGAVRGHHRHSGLDQHPDRQSEQLVDAPRHADVVDPHAVARRDLRAQLEGLGVSVPRCPRDRLAHRLRGPGRHPERALVGPDPHRELRPRRRSIASGPTKGTVAGNPATMGVKGTRCDIFTSSGTRAGAL